MTFEWDDEKNSINIKKHGISFSEAAMVFLDDKRIEKIDLIHSTIEEERVKVIGVVHKVVVVIYTERNKNIRMISARFAEKEEINEYYRNYDIR